MNALKRWTAAALALVIAGSVSPVLAVPAAEPFADFRIDALNMDIPDRTLSIDLYCRNESGGFSPADTAVDPIHCKVNRVTGDAMFYIQPRTDGVQVTVDYLTDVNGDGLYELLDGGGQPVWDTLDPMNELIQGGNPSLSNEQTYFLSAETLSQRFETAAQARARDLGLEAGFQTFPLCRVTLRHTGADDGREYEQLYYLEICGQILAPPDVSRDQWYYDAVEYNLIQGWFTGMGDGRFCPDEPLNRSQLAQVLWTTAGRPVTEPADYADVFTTDWFCQAVAWCRWENLMTGYEDGTFLPNAPLTREQLASVLQRYEGYAHPGTAHPAYPDALAQFSDADSVPPWALDSMRWVASLGLLPVSDNSLRPGDTVTRAELAFALYTYHTRDRQYDGMD